MSEQIKRLVPVNAARYDGLIEVFKEAISEHCHELVRGGHGKPPVDCSLCTALRYLIAPGAPTVGVDERAYLDVRFPQASAAPAQRVEDGG